MNSLYEKKAFENVPEFFESKIVPVGMVTFEKDESKPFCIK